MTKVLILRASGKIRPIPISGLDLIQISIVDITPNEEVINKVSLENVNYIIIMSTTVVKYLGEKIRQLNSNARVIGVGPQTCSEVKRLGTACDMPREFSSHGIIEMMRELPRGRIAILRSLKGNDYMRKELSRIGYDVIEYGIYDVTPNSVNVDITCRLINYVDYVAFMSPMTYEAIRDCARKVLEGKTVISIGRVTASRMKYDGLNPLMPSEYTLDGVLKILMNHLMTSNESLG